MLHSVAENKIDATSPAEK